MTVDTYIKYINQIYEEQPIYKRGHDGSDGYCDCIGMIKGAIRRGGETPTGLKGTNYAARYTIKDFREITSVSQLRVGDVVLKYRNPGSKYYDLPDEYKEGGCNYNGDLRDYSHIGTVTHINPLEITHMTDPTAKKDDKIGNWKCVGTLPQVSGESPIPPIPVTLTATVYAAKGSTVNLRQKPSTSSKLVERVPIGSVVEIRDKEPDWCQVVYTDDTGAKWYGWMMTEFLIFEDPSTDLYTVNIYHLIHEEALAISSQYPDSVIIKE